MKQAPRLAEIAVATVNVDVHTDVHANVHIPSQRGESAVPKLRQQPQRPELSRPAEPRRSTCRASCLDSSGQSRGHNGGSRTGRAGLDANLSLYQTDACRPTRRSGGWSGPSALPVQVCVAIHASSER